MSGLIYILKGPQSNWRSVAACLASANQKISPIEPNNLFSVRPGSILIVPGVGNMESFCAHIEKSVGIKNFREILFNKGVKTIGICLGFQFMCRVSAEAPNWRCLNLLNTEICSLFVPEQPSVGWRKISQTKVPAENLSKFDANALANKYFYFTHSFGVTDKSLDLGNFDVYTYNLEDGRVVLAAAISETHIGYQFHPEKSGVSGRTLLIKSINFLRG